MSTLTETLGEVYSSSRNDNWSGELIREESGKVHETIRSTMTSITTILTSDNASAEDKEWARKQIEKLL